VSHPAVTECPRVVGDSADHVVGVLVERNRGFAGAGVVEGQRRYSGVHREPHPPRVDVHLPGVHPAAGDQHRPRGAALITLLLAAWADDEVGPTLRAILQTAAHEPATREKLRRVVEGNLMGVSELGGDERDRLIRSGLISSQMMGFALMRYVWKIEPTASMTDDEVIAAITPNLQHYVSGDLSS
jgi:hypothetical protein